MTARRSRLCLQEGQEQGFLDADGGMLFIGPEAERRFGHRHFMGLMAVFTAPPEFTVLHGRDEIGRVDPSLLADRVQGPRLLLLGGRSWRVSWTDRKRRRCSVEPAEGGGRARWLSAGVGGLSFEIARSMRDVLLGADVPVSLTQRAVGCWPGCAAMVPATRTPAGSWSAEAMMTCASGRGPGTG
jgi:ATP-dependent helicase Lhr and Lhr-like helicase